MKKTFKILSEAVAQSAVDDGNKLGFQAESSQLEDGTYEISYASSYDEPTTQEETAKPTYDDLGYMRKEFAYEMKYMREDMAYMSQSLMEHKKGHLPPFADAGKFKAALETLGLGESYDVRKPTISVEY